MSASHRPGSLKQHNKPFKSRHSTKGQLKDATKGRVNRENGHRAGPKQLAPGQAKADRRNAARLAQRSKREELLARLRSVGAFSGAPKLVAFVSLCPNLLATEVMQQALASEDVRVTATEGPSVRCTTERFRQRFVMYAAGANLYDILDATKVADYVVLAMSSQVEVDDFGLLILGAIQAQGCPVIVPVVPDLEAAPPKQRGDIKKSLLSFIQHHFPNEPKVHALESPSDRLLFLRHLAEAPPRTVHWRESHPYLLVEEAEELADGNETDETVTVRLTGYSRGTAFFANRLVHLPGYGDFQLRQIEAATDPDQASRLNLGGRARHLSESSTAPTDMMTDAAATTTERPVLQMPDPERQESLVEENTPDPLDAEQTWPTEEELAEAEEAAQARRRRGSGSADGDGDVDGTADGDDDGGVSVSGGRLRVTWGGAVPNPFAQPRRVKRVPKGTSSYQAAWIIDSDSEDGQSGDEDEEEEDVAVDDAAMAAESAADKEAPEESESESESEEEYEEVPLDEDFNTLDYQLNEDEEQEQLQSYLDRKKALLDELQWPDEVDTPLNTPALVRFAKYRGLQSAKVLLVASFRNSPWDPYENLPPEYARIYDFADFKRSQKRLLQETGGVAPYSYISLVVADVPRAYLAKFREQCAKAAPELPALPLVVYGLLPYENKTTVLHFTILRHALSDDAVVRSKDPFVLQAAFRRWNTQPIFSEHTVADKHKFERFLPPGRTLVASVYGPVCFPPAPMLLFRENGPGVAPTLIGMGSLLEVQPRRVIIKRIVLTGDIFKIHKRTATIRYMFFNREDVLWFKPVQLRSKGGRTGHILGPLGTHGYMKCQFDAPLRADDVICMHLYKRVYPKWKAQLHQRTEPRMVEHVAPADEASDEAANGAGGDDDDQWVSEHGDDDDAMN